MTTTQKNTINNNNKKLTLFQDIFHLLILKWTRQFTIVQLIKLVEEVKTNQKSIYITVILSKQKCLVQSNPSFKIIEASRKLPKGCYSTSTSTALAV